MDKGALFSYSWDVFALWVSRPKVLQAKGLTKQKLLSDFSVQHSLSYGHDLAGQMWKKPVLNRRKWDGSWKKLIFCVYLILTRTPDTILHQETPGLLSVLLCAMATWHLTSWNTQTEILYIKIYWPPYSVQYISSTHVCLHEFDWETINITHTFLGTYIDNLYYNILHKYADRFPPPVCTEKCKSNLFFGTADLQQSWRSKKGREMAQGISELLPGMA